MVHQTLTCNWEPEKTRSERIGRGWHRVLNARQAIEHDGAVTAFHIEETVDCAYNGCAPDEENSGQGPSRSRPTGRHSTSGVLEVFHCPTPVQRRKAAISESTHDAGFARLLLPSGASGPAVEVCCACHRYIGCGSSPTNGGDGADVSEEILAQAH